MPFLRRLSRFLVERLAPFAMLLLMPLLVRRGLLADQFTSPKFLLMEAATLLCLTVVALDLLWRRCSRLPRFSLALPLAVWAATVVVSLANSPAPVFALGDVGAFLCGPAWLLVLVVCGGEGVVRRLALLASLAGTAVAAVTLVQWAGWDALMAGGFHIEWGTKVEKMRLYSTLGNPNFVAGYLVGVVFLAVTLAMGAAGKARRWLWGTAAAAMVAATVVTGSRGAWLGLAVGAAGFLLIARRRVAATPRAAAAVSRARTRGAKARSMLLLPFLALAGAALPASLTSIPTTLAGRWYLWRVAWPMFTDHPLLGSGWGSVQLRFLDLQARFLAVHPELVKEWDNVKQIHNDPLQLLLETGLLGFAAFAWFLWTYVRSAGVASAVTRSNHTRLWVAASVGGVIALLTDSLFSFELAMPPTLILLFTLLAVPSLLGEEPDPPRAPGRRTGPPDGPLAVAWLRALATAVVLALAIGLAVPLVRHATAETRFTDGLRCEARHDWAGAEIAFRQAVSPHGAQGRYHFGLARALFLRGRLAEALSEALVAKRTFADPHIDVLQARILDHMGERAPALAAFKRALLLDPNLTSVQDDIARLSR